MSKQHKSPVNYRAKAPYNFVPLPEEVLEVTEQPPTRDCYHEDKFTGYIDLKITTETPLYTRCAFPPLAWSDKGKLDDKGNPKVTLARECQEFFYRSDKAVPVIPGSTLRGMARSLVEILSYSKIFAVSDKQLVYRAVADSTSFGNQYREKMLDKLGTKHFNYPSLKLKGGYLEVDRNDNHFIRPAQEPSSCGESFVHLENYLVESANHGETIYVEAKNRERFDERGQRDDITLEFAYSRTVSTTPAAGLVPARLVKTKGVGGHMNCAIFEPDTDDSKLIEISEKMWKTYVDDREMQRGIKSKVIRKHGDLLFYLLDNSGKLFFFGATMMFRLAYSNKITALIPEHLKNAGLDFAEAIFGNVIEKTKETIAGRVYFSDAVCTTGKPFLEDDFEGRFIPKILSSPKPTAFQLYLNQPEPNHHRNDEARCFILKDSSFERMREENLPDVVINKAKKLNGYKFDSKEDLLKKLADIGVFFTNNGQRNAFLNCVSHQLKTYNDADETQIRGFKRYWHRRNIDENYWAENKADFRVKTYEATNKKPKEEVFEQKDGNKWEKDTQHTIIKPVLPQTDFISRVYFENLSNVELGALLIALELPPNMRHQIGMAKPYGLGSVKIEPKKLVLQNRKKRYAALFNEQDGSFSNGAKLDVETSKIKTEAENAFKEKVLKHFNDIVQANSRAANFWQIPRLETLATILEWETADNFDRKEYTGLQTEDDKRKWRERRVLPYPQNVEKDIEPREVDLINPSISSQESVQTSAGEGNSVVAISENAQDTVVQKIPRIPLGLLKLPIKYVPTELGQYYPKWLEVIDETLKIEMAKVIYEKGKTWKRFGEKDWHKVIIEFVEKNKTVSGEVHGTGGENESSDFAGDDESLDEETIQ